MSHAFADALGAVVAALDRLGVPYFVGGSIAAVMHGEIRTTHDVDVIVELGEAMVAPLVAELAPQFFVDETLMRDAVRTRTSCNVIHRASAFKVDLFPRQERAFSRSEMERRRRAAVLPGLDLNIATAEDCVLAKLEWYEKGNRASDRQWRDVLGIMKTQRLRLDRGYLQRWAAELGIERLLHQALREAGIDP